MVYPLYSGLLCVSYALFRGETLIFSELLNKRFSSEALVNKYPLFFLPSLLSFKSLAISGLPVRHWRAVLQSLSPSAPCESLHCLHPSYSLRALHCLHLF